MHSASPQSIRLSGAPFYGMAVIAALSLLATLGADGILLWGLVNASPALSRDATIGLWFLIAGTTIIQLTTAIIALVAIFTSQRWAIWSSVALFTPTAIGFVMGVLSFKG